MRGTNNKMFMDVGHLPVLDSYWRRAGGGRGKLIGICL